MLGSSFIADTTQQANGKRSRQREKEGTDVEATERKKERKGKREEKKGYIISM
jgi:hypothetical protein